MRALLLALLAVSAGAQAPLESYRVENVPLPRDIAPEVENDLPDKKKNQQDGRKNERPARGFLVVHGDRPGHDAFRPFAVAGNVVRFASRNQSCRLA